jgi:KipI family sensor histidine kinase inhibitor
MAAAPRIVMAGDSLVILDLEARIDPAINRRAVAIALALRAASLPGVRDVVTTYHTVAVHFDPLRTPFDRLHGALETLAREEPPADDVAGPLIEVPVCYGGELGPDLADVARHAACDEDEVVRRHAGVTYRVYMLGFVPGFAYLGTVDDRIAMPRRDTPRLKVPAGAVGIANGQTGIYPAETPGGWRLIGRTPVLPFDPRRAEPFLFAPGHAVRFIPVSRDAFDALAATTTTA